jgi:DNA-binding IscR family transcriptional regulator
MQDADIDPSIPAVLIALWQARREAGGKPSSLARIAKCAGLPMSVLRRVLTQLQSAGLVDVALDEAGRGQAGLTEAGAQLAAQAFPDLA